MGREQATAEWERSRGKEGEGEEREGRRANQPGQTQNKHPPSSRACMIPARTGAQWGTAMGEARASPDPPARACQQNGLEHGAHLHKGQRARLSGGEWAGNRGGSIELVAMGGWTGEARASQQGYVARPLGIDGSAKTRGGVTSRLPHRLWLGRGSGFRSASRAVWRELRWGWFRACDAGTGAGYNQQRGRLRRGGKTGGGGAKESQTTEGGRG
ncbi:hypothetical protein CALVIDRAFT_96487 [Calocera viscosa TUFC12733]|uniref:Uncharacterized protein n=1 Tax=Calocera viscosa (strain TUFC12733) TaxID=1330018 RepID=A0A167MZ06_CALVF|nr:hypothetical protein CALVIDRAFT_96487 [Calocera viscosa TUFC12733]